MLNALQNTLLAAACLLLSACSPAAEIPSEDAAETPADNLTNILLVMTNHADMGDTGKPTGVWLDEASHPWKVFTTAGVDVTLASPLGGDVPIDPRSLEAIDEDGRAFLDAFAPNSDTTVEGTLSLADINPADYNAVFFAGGHGTMWDFPIHENVKKVGETIYANGGVVAAVCHGPAALIQMTTPEGAPLVQGKTIAIFTDDEERAVELEDVVPFLLETKLRELGANIQLAPNFQPNVAVDGRLVTGQNPASATGTAEGVLQALGLN